MTDISTDANGPEVPQESGRSRAAKRRDRVSRQRDLSAHRRDEDGQRRDEIAASRDAAAADREKHQGPPGSADVSGAAADRAQSGLDRRAAGSDRLEAAQDRGHAADDRREAAQDRLHASVDALTGVYTREAGLAELDRDIARVRRGSHHLVVAFVDVDHLKAINDSRGHAAGDRLLRHVADTLVSALRRHDLVIRHGGDEFLCAIQGIDAAAARLRLAQVNNLLADSGEPGSVTIGLAELGNHESRQDVIARADADLYQRRQHRPR